MTRGWRSSARDARRSTSETRSADVAPRVARVDPFAQRGRLVGVSEQQLVLRRVVTVQRPQRDARTGRDVAHLHRFVAAFCGQRRLGVEQTPLSFGRFRRARPVPEAP